MNTGIGGHQLPNRGRTDEWYTPPHIFDALGLRFDLDPCSPEQGPVPWIPAQTFISLRDDGLTAAWTGRVWLNPPYGFQTGAWLRRLADHGNGIALTFARTDTRWFHESAVKADVLCFIAGRPHFFMPGGERAPHNSGGPLMLLAYGSECAEAVQGSGLGAAMTHRREVMPNGPHDRRPIREAS